MIWCDAGDSLAPDFDRPWTILIFERFRHHAFLLAFVHCSRCRGGLHLVGRCPCSGRRHRLTAKTVETDQADKDDADGGSSNSPDDGNTTPWLRILDASSKSKAAPIIGVILAVVSLLLAAYNTFGSQIPALQKLIKG